MEFILNAAEARVLGCLIEKEKTTPEYYPLSLNGLTNACNQKSNRDPVMNMTETEVVRALDSLRDKKLAWQLSTAGGRVPKFEHNIKSLFTFSDQEIAVLCVLLLRGPQTAGEIRGRTDRLYFFAGIDEVEKTLKQLVERNDGPFVKELPRRPGRKESRYVQLFTGEPDLSSFETPVAQGAITGTDEDRISQLEMEVGELRSTLEKLRSDFEEFKKMFG